MGPKLWFDNTLGLTGAAFCHGCGLGSRFEGQLFFGCVNDGVLRLVALHAARDDVSGSAVGVLDSPTTRSTRWRRLRTAPSTSATSERSTAWRVRDVGSTLGGVRPSEEVVA
jgi:hypothetical protein